MTGDDYATGREVEAAVPFVRGWISKEDACRGARCEFVFGSGLQIWVTEAPKDTHMVVGGWLFVQASEGNVMLDGGGWTLVK